MASGFEQNQQAVGGIIEDRFQTGMQQRLEVFDALKIDRILEFVQYPSPPVGRDIQVVAELLQPGSDAVQDIIRQQDLPRGEQHQLLQRLQRTLGDRVKGADCLGGIAEKLDP